jgi:hypothetical protein
MKIHRVESVEQSERNGQGKSIRKDDCASMERHYPLATF